MLEPLESRRLLAGIHVSVYVDGNGSRGFETNADTPAANRLVYVDLDHSGAYNSGEPIQVTGIDGTAFFDGLPGGDYSVGLITNPRSQAQVEPTSVARNSQTIFDASNARAVGTADLGHVWSIDADGNIRPIIGGPAMDGTSSDAGLSLGGAVTASTTVGNTAWLVHETTSGVQLSTVDLETGAAHHFPLGNLSSEESIVELVTTQSKVIGLVATPDGNAAAELTQSNGIAVLGSRTALNASQILGSPANDSVFAISSANDQTQIQVIDFSDASDGFLIPMSVVSGSTAQAALSADGAMLLLATDVGVKALSVSPSGLTLVAWLSEATGPVSASSVDGRIITGSAAHANELIVWDTASWLPIGRTQLSSPAESLLGSRRGNVALTRNASAIERVNLAVAGMQQVTVASESQASVRLGVQVIGTNTAPDVSQFETVQPAVEDTALEMDLSERGIADADDDTLWYTLSTPASHGDLQVDAFGIWKYTPKLNFNGSDSAVVRVHDGLSTTDVRIQWNVAAVNDPPESIHVESQPIQENAPIGTELGLVSIVDADRDAHYRINTSDPRFTVENGRIYLTSGELDFETEATVLVQIEAVDSSDESIRITTLANLVIVDTNEAPTGIRLTSTDIAENTSGGVVGTIEVDDPDANNDFEFTVSDPRFIVDGNQLRLLDDQSLNFEIEPTVDLRITARDKSASYEKAADFALSILDLDDAPTELLLSSVEVEELVDGGVVGEVTVVDEDGGVYDFDVSDERFEVVGSTLKLRDDVQLNAAAASLVNLTVTARSRSGPVIANNFPLNVVPPKSPWQNPTNPHDVNGDGDLTPLDALILVNLLNKFGSHPLQPSPGSGEGPQTMPDVNGDGNLTPLDVLLIINELNDKRGEGESSGPIGGNSSGDDTSGGFRLSGSSQFGESETERRKRLNSEIDAELELLVDQINQPHS